MVSIGTGATMAHLQLIYQRTEQTWPLRVERARNFDGDLERLVERERTFPDTVRESLAFDVLHHEKVRADVMERADVWIQPHREIRAQSRRVSTSLARLVIRLGRNIRRLAKKLH